MSSDLTTADKQLIEQWTSRFERGLDALEKAKQLNVGDYLVLYIDNQIRTNSYGAPIKFKVVHSTRHGIPFVKKVNKKGDPVGQIYSCTGSLDTDDYNQYGDTFEFRLDPDYADSIILQDQYDPSQLHKSRQEMWKEVTAHNKNAKVNTTHLGGIVKFFEKVNVGDTLWTSNIGHYLVQDKEIMTRQDFKNNVKDTETRTKGPFIIVLTVRDKKGKIFKITADFFSYKALYRERPRTYKELKT